MKVFFYCTPYEYDRQKCDILQISYYRDILLQKHCQGRISTQCAANIVALQDGTRNVYCSFLWSCMESAHCHTGSMHMALTLGNNFDYTLYKTKIHKQRNHEHNLINRRFTLPILKVLIYSSTFSAKVYMFQSATVFPRK